MQQSTHSVDERAGENDLVSFLFFFFFRGRRKIFVGLKRERKRKRKFMEIARNCMKRCARYSNSFRRYFLNSHSPRPTRQHGQPVLELSFSFAVYGYPMIESTPLEGGFHRLPFNSHTLAWLGGFSPCFPGEFVRNLVLSRV